MTFDPLPAPIAPAGLGPGWVLGFIVSIIVVAAAGATIVSRSRSNVVRVGLVVLAVIVAALASYGWVDRTERLSAEHDEELTAWRTQVTDRIEGTWDVEIVAGDVAGDWLGRNADGRIVACSTHNRSVFTVTCDGIEPDTVADDDRTGDGATG